MIEIAVQSLTDTSATLYITDDGSPTSVSVRVTTTGEDPRDGTSSADGLVSFAGLTAATTYDVKAGTVAPILSQFTTKATGYDDPRTATQEQWQDLVDRIKAKSDVSITMTTTDPGEGSVLAANHYVGVYGGDPVVVDYSTNEINTGTKWIDGAVIYKKTISFGALPNTATRAVAHGITGLSQVVKIEGIASTANGNYTTLPFTPSAPSALCDLIVGTTDIRMTAADDRSAWNSSYVTIYYTKSS